MLNIFSIEVPVLNMITINELIQMLKVRFYARNYDYNCLNNATHYVFLYCCGFIGVCNIFS